MSKINTNRLIQVIAIGFILVVCPAASWYYLQKGLDYQKDSRKELVAKESLDIRNLIPEFISQDTAMLDNKLRLLILNELGDDEALNELKAKLVDQFKESKGVFILELLKSGDGNSSSKQLNEMQILKTIDSEEYNDIATRIIGVPTYTQKDGKTVLDVLDKTGNTTANDKVYCYLIDENEKVRNVYNILEEDKLKRMIEHIAILIPRQNKEEVELRREKEM